MFVFQSGKAVLVKKNSVTFVTPGNGPLLNLLKMPHLPPSTGKGAKIAKAPD